MHTVPGTNNVARRYYMVDGSMHTIVLATLSTAAAQISASHISHHTSHISHLTSHMPDPSGRRGGCRFGTKRSTCSFSKYLLLFAKF